MARILYVDDEPQEVSLFKAEVGCFLPQHEIVSFNSLSDARAAVARGEHFDLFVCDSNIHDEKGEDWARELAVQGRKVLMFSNRGFDDLPSVKKGYTDELIEAILKLLGNLKEETDATR